MNLKVMLEESSRSKYMEREATNSPKHSRHSYKSSLPNIHLLMIKLKDILLEDISLFSVDVVSYNR